MGTPGETLLELLQENDDEACVKYSETIDEKLERLGSLFDPNSPNQVIDPVWGIDHADGLKMYGLKMEGLYGD